jgi:hypothetical protein
MLARGKGTHQHHLPPGLALNPGTGVVNGTPTMADPYNFTIGCSGANGQYAEKPCSVVVNQAPGPAVPSSIGIGLAAI